MAMMDKIYNEIGRFGSYGIARKNAKDRETEVGTGRKHYIFKDVSDGPFTSFKTDAYVLMEGPATPYNDILPSDDEETEEDEE